MSDEKPEGLEEFLSEFPVPDDNEGRVALAIRFIYARRGITGRPGVGKIPDAKGLGLELNKLREWFDCFDEVPYNCREKWFLDLRLKVRKDMHIDWKSKGRRTEDTSSMAIADMTDITDECIKGLLKAAKGTDDDPRPMPGYLKAAAMIAIKRAQVQAPPPKTDININNNQLTLQVPADQAGQMRLIEQGHRQLANLRRENLLPGGDEVVDGEIVEEEK